MAGRIDAEQVRHIGNLARLKLSDDEVERFGEQLSSILTYVEKLNELDTSGVEPTAHALPVSNVFRNDEPGPTLSPSAALANAPARDGSFFVVPKVLEQDSG